MAIILDHIIGLFVEVLEKDMFFLNFSFKFYLSFSIYLALMAFLSLSSSTDQLLLFFLKGPIFYCYLCIFSCSVSTLISGSTTIFYFFWLSKMFRLSLNLLLRALTISSINFVAFSSFKDDYWVFISGSSRLNEKNLRLLWLVFSLMKNFNSFPSMGFSWFMASR